MLSLITAATIAVCPPPPARRYTCVHDGDTVWLEGEKIRLLAIDAPELTTRHRGTKQRADAARDRLVQLLREGELVIERDGTDCYGRTLAHIITPRGSVAQRLIAEGLADRYTGPRHPICR